ncbi:hypothetical protein Tco_0764571 [Tanacetum coccineum]
MSFDEFDKETGSSDGLQPKQGDLSCVHAVNELHFHEIHVVLTDVGVVVYVGLLSDYEYSLMGLAEDRDERARVKHEVHTRRASACSDTRPPMLDRTDYESWSQRIRLYCRGKENGLQILQSIDQGPFELGTTRDALGTTPEGGVLLGPERPRTYEDLSDTEKKRRMQMVRPPITCASRLPKDIYKLINHNIKAKAIWDNVKMLLAGSELTKEDRESQLYDEFERFKMLPGENINEYYVRFHKLVNDMRNIRMTMPNIQLNSKFVNNMSPEMDRFVTPLNSTMSEETNSQQLYAYLK